MNIQNIIQRIYTHRQIRITLHILFWAAITGLQKYLSAISFNNVKQFPDTVLNLLLMIGTLQLMFFFYPFVYWILPRFFYRKRFIAGALLTLLLGICHAFISTLGEELIINCDACMKSMQVSNTGYEPFLHKDIPARLIPKVLSMGHFIMLLFNIALPLSIKLGMQALRQQLRAMQLAKENLQLEFDFLRSQVNPHFLFNTLNNVYGLILKNENEKSAATVARLSQFLRYSLYESNSERVPVEKEIQLLKDYVELESLRLNHIRVQLNHTIDGSVSAMAPLLLMPIIENSFKHTKDVPDAYITIDLKIANKNIHVLVVNSIDPLHETATPGGIGLSNLKKRLDLYYPRRYTYKTNHTATVYTVSINIDCHE
jgi:sensor histidine kinase YesM